MLKSKNVNLVFLFLFLATIMSGCEVIGGLLEIGFWAGVVVVVIIVVILAAIIRAFRRRR